MNILNAAAEAATGLSAELDGGLLPKELGDSIGLAQQSIPRRTLQGRAAERGDCRTHASVLPEGHAAKSGRGLTSKSEARVDFPWGSFRSHVRTSSGPSIGIGEGRSLRYTHRSCWLRVAEIRLSCCVKRRIEVLSPVLRTMELIVPALIGVLIPTSSIRPLAALEEMLAVSRRSAESSPSGSSPPTNWLARMLSSEAPLG